MKPLITIGIPSFNSARWLGQAIESALAQTWPEKEVLVVDDGSTDGSADVARGFGDRIQFIATENRGGNHARNLAVQAARGEWLQFLDADDYLEATKVAQQLTEVSPESADVIYSPVQIETGIGGAMRGASSQPDRHHRSTSTRNGSHGKFRKPAGRYGGRARSKPLAVGRKDSRVARNTNCICAPFKRGCALSSLRARWPFTASGRKALSAGKILSW